MELRLYTFCNFYLSSIQQGIQTAHIVSELFTEQYNDRQHELLHRWARHDKTIITLNGGNQAMLEEFMSFLEEHALEFRDYPVTCFHEDEQSLNSAMTAVGIVLDETIFNAQYDRETGYYVYESEDGHNSFTYTEGPLYELIARVKGCRLAS